MSALAKLTLDMDVKDGGTYDVFLTPVHPKKGYAVSLTSNVICSASWNGWFRSTKVEYIRERLLELYRMAISEGINHYYVGFWKNEAALYLDLTVIIDSKEDAIMNAIRYNQKAIWDFNTNSEISMEDYK